MAKGGMGGWDCWVDIGGGCGGGGGLDFVYCGLWDVGWMKRNERLKRNDEEA